MRPVNITASGAKDYYYEKDPIFNAEGKHENTQWHGTGAKALGLTCRIRKDEFERVIDGRNPRTGEQLVDYTPRHVNGTLQERRAAIDIPFSAPKSVSIAAIHNGDARLIEAHDKAVFETIKHLEADYAQYRRTEDGQTVVEHSDNLVVATFRHATSRENDPQLHSHTLIMNMTRNAEGGWQATHNDAIFRDQKLINSIYQSYLARNAKELGYAVDARPNGTWELRGYDERQLELFSKRSEKIEQLEQKLHEDGTLPHASDAQINRVATLESRPDKNTGMTAPRLHALWDAQDRANGISKEQVMHDLQAAGEVSRQAAKGEAGQKMDENGIVRKSSEVVNEKESTFKPQDVYAKALSLGRGDYTYADIKSAYDDCRRTGEIVRLGENCDARGNRSEIYTTQRMLARETDTLWLVRDGKGAVRPVATLEEVRTAIGNFEQAKGITLTEGQVRAVEHILNARDRVIGIQGDAGTGKTTSLELVRTELEKKGFEVRGLSKVGKAAGGLEDKSGIASQTLDSFLGSGPSASGRPQAWIVDEASLTGSLQLHELISRSERENARVVLVGDTKQAKAVDAGDLFHQLQKKGVLATVTMSENIRQQEDSYRAMVDDLAAKRVDSAFDRLESQGRVSEHEQRDKRLQSAVDHYTKSGDSGNTVIVTGLNRDRQAINAMVRQELKNREKLADQEQLFRVREDKRLDGLAKHFAQSYQKDDILFANKAGILGRAGAEGTVQHVDQERNTITVQLKTGKTVEIDVREHGNSLSAYRERVLPLAAGEKIIFSKKDTHYGVYNGTTAEVQEIDKQGAITVKTENGKVITFNDKQMPYFDHGYALTVEKSQGITEHKVIWYADTTHESRNTLNAAYVSISRGKHDVRVITQDKALLREQVRNEQVKTSTLDHAGRESARQEIEKSKLDRAALSNIEKLNYPGFLGRMEYFYDKLAGKIPGARIIGNRSFNYTRARDLMQRREEVLEKYAHTGNAKHLEKAGRIERKIDGEFAKMSPEERDRFATAQKELNHGSGTSRTGKRELDTTEKSMLLSDRSRNLDTSERPLADTRAGEKSQEKESGHSREHNSHSEHTLT